MFNRQIFLSRSLRAGLAALSIALPWSAQAQSWPTKPVRVVVAFTAGGTTDILARMVAQQMSERLKQQFVIDNRPGGGGNIGTELVVRAAPDGYTLIVNSVGPIAVNSSLYGKLGYNPQTDLVPMVQIADVPNVLVVNSNSGIRSMEDLLSFARANPGQLNYGSTGTGTSAHLSSFMLTQRAQVQATHIPYKGADVLRDLMAGRIQFMFATIPSVMPLINAGKLTPLAVSSLKRSRSLPEIPTVIEKGFPGFEAGSWFGFFAPRGTPEDVIALVNSIVNDILKMPAIEQQMIAQGADPAGGTATQFGQFVQRETDKWRGIVRDSGATAE
jgi:tripartite-type tricarboxylate transporter receptor subunit TctC